MVEEHRLLVNYTMICQAYMSVVERNGAEAVITLNYYCWEYGE